jgi:hypothetical protein
MILATWQRWLLLIVLLSTVATLTELLLLEHTEEFYQLIPVILLGVMAASTVTLLLAPRRWSINLFRAVMLFSLLSAAVGIYLHYRANVEFVLERYPAATGADLFKRAIMGALPALAPGAMAQLALIGLLATLPRRAA